MARNRQRAKQRQAARKAGGGDGARSDGASKRTGDREAPAQPTQPPADGHDDVERAVDLETGAPREDLGSSDSTLQYEQDLEEYAEEAELESEEELDEEELAREGVYPDEVHGEDVAEQSQPTGGPRGRRGGEEARHHSNVPRFVQFLRAVRAELKRVEWPKRQALTTLTGVVLGFVLITGGYLGLLDAIFSKLIQSLL
jgi:preprotein translocase subunit SecE